MPEPRGGLLRTKTGCLTCRVRRVKCDEAKPYCRRCSNTGRKCDGYSSTPISRRELIARQFSDPNLTATERKCFELVQVRTAKVEWDLILQLSHLEPSIRHGILALGSLHHEFEYDATNSLQSYHKAIQHTRELNDPTKILAACILFVCCENVMGNYQLAKMHLQNGLKIAQQSNIDESVLQILGRLDFQAMTFNETDTGYSHIQPEVANMKIPYSFSTIRDARESMVGIQKWAMGIAQNFQSNGPSKEAIESREICRGKLSEWKTAFNRSKHEKWTVPMPIMYWALATMMIEAGCEMEETAWDRHLDLFEIILNAGSHRAKVKGFSVEVGTTVPLFAVGCKCRDPKIRRKAIELMKTPRQEGIWYSPAASKVAERVLQIEEGNLVVQEAKDIPESARVRVVLTEMIPEKRQIKVNLQMTSLAEWSHIEEILQY